MSVLSPDTIGLIAFIVLAIATTICFTVLIVFTIRTDFKTDARTKIAKLRKDYYAQENRTPEKDAEFKKEVKAVERKYKL